MQRLLRHRVVFVIAMILLASCRNDQHEHASHGPQQEQDVYTCPMHPEIIKNAPGQCPVCGMDLVKKETGGKALQNIELETLLQPANGFAISTIRTTRLEQKEENIELDVVGKVAYDTRQSGSIAARVNGRIEKLYVRYKYQPIKKGQRIMDIYSPELVSAQQNLIFLLGNDSMNHSLIDAAKARLVFLGMTAAQVSDIARTKDPKYSVAVFSNYNGFVTNLPSPTASSQADGMETQSSANEELNIKEGMYVKSGQAVLAVYNPGRAWILLDIFPEQQNLVKIGNPVRVVPETAPQQNFRSKIEYIEPVFRQGSKTLTARVHFNNADKQLPIGSRVSATIFASSVSAAWLPKEAVLSLGRDKIVFRRDAGGFRAHKVTTGIEVNRSIQVVNGLSTEDSVAMNVQFLVDNEAFIKVSNQ